MNANHFGYNEVPRVRYNESSLYVNICSVRDYTLNNDSHKVTKRTVDS